MKTNKLKALQKKWYDKYLPFVARSPETQLDWLKGAFRKKTLSSQEIMPYIKIFLSDANTEKHDLLVKLLAQQEEVFIDNLVNAADIYDIPVIIILVAKPTIKQAVLALKKSPPPYEKNPQSLLDKVFWALHNHAESYLEKAGEVLLKSNDVPDHFEKEFKRFQEILEDEKILSALYPKARAK